MKTFVSKIFSKKSSSVEQSEKENQVLRKTSEEPIHVEYETEDQTSYKIDVYIHDEKTDSYDILPTEVTRIGRDPSQADVSIPEIIVSKLHCTIYFKDDAAFIKDNDSTNGTYVNNQKITEHMLMNNDIITLGKKGVVRIVFYRQ
jgi:pSer/pThr/pTyr-binding forkhead associated (FHA) protein